MPELYQLTIDEACEGLRKRDFSSHELTRAILDRIDTTEASIHAFLTVAHDLVNRNSVQLRSQGGPLGASLIVQGQLINERYLYASNGGERSITATIDNPGFFYVDDDTQVIGDLANRGYMRLLANASLDIIGAFDQHPTGRAEIYVGGTTAGQSHGQVNVDSPVSLAGQFRVRPSGNQPPACPEQPAPATQGPQATRGPVAPQGGRPMPAIAMPVQNPTLVPMHSSVVPPMQFGDIGPMDLQSVQTKVCEPARDCELSACHAVHTCDQV